MLYTPLIDIGYTDVIPKVIYPHREVLCNDDKYVTGIDVSKYQGVINWDLLDTNEIKFVIVKSTEGLTIVDKHFKTNWNKIPVKKGSYHFFHPRTSGKKQAQKFLSTVKFDKGHIIPVIDVEYTRKWKRHRNIAIKNLKEMVSEIIKVTGIKPIIYTNGKFWNDYIKPHYNESDHILWVSDYRDREEPYIPSNYNDWHIWQWTNKGVVSGIKGKVDMNYLKIPIDSILIE